ncbi:hypothetical protein ACFOKI_11510 [Sphingomonas qilianensis]|uniref:Uncharacterized protein n=1 Tax=Sphingomonas qilianensis TaxID=1736690 RepID=A0ABU9XP83_9SPHN
MVMIFVLKLLGMALLATTAAPPATAQDSAVNRGLAVAGPPYPLFVDLTLAAPVIVDATIRRTTRIKGGEAATVPAGFVRLYIEADVLALLRGPQALPGRIGYLLDVQPDSRGRLPQLKRLRVLLFARPVTGRADQIQLVRPDAQRPWSPAADDLTRRIATEVVSGTAPPEITGVGNAFHVAGSLPGEGETQIFLTTADGRPVSLGIARRPDQPPLWGVSLADVVDQRGAPPPRDTLLWYRLACALPATLPDSAVGETERPNADIAREDYRFVIESLGPCTRE